jgi:hypothetical protein
MATVEVAFEGRSVQTDGKTSRANIQFICKGFASDYEALNAPGVPRASQGPLGGDRYPYDDKLRADSKRVVKAINATDYIVEVNYSNDGSYRFPDRPPANQPDYKSSAFATRKTVVKMPTFVKAGAWIEGPNGTPIEGFQWVQKTNEIEVAETVYTVTLNLFNFTSDDEFSIINQVGYIHRFPDNSDWRFEGGDSTQTAIDRWQIVYRWSRRERVDPPGLLGGDFIGPRESLYFYEEYYPVPSPLPLGDPVIRKLTRYSTDHLTDWRTLPGYPLG